MPLTSVTTPVTGAAPSTPVATRPSRSFWDWMNLSLRLTTSCFALAALVFYAACAWGWFPRLCLLAILVSLCNDQHLARWAREPGGGTRAWADGMVERALATVVVLCGLATAQYVVDLQHGGPASGLATARGRPQD